MPIRTRLLRTALSLPILFAAVACSDESADGRDTVRIEDLGNEVLYVISEAEPLAQFEGDSEAFLERLGFVPVYPSVVPHQYRLSSASMSGEPAGGDDQSFALSLQYLMNAPGSDLITVGQFMGDALPRPGMRSEAIDVGGVEGWLIYPGGTEAFVLAWHACDRVISIQSGDIGESEAIAMAESIECPDAEG